MSLPCQVSKIWMFPGCVDSCLENPRDEGAWWAAVYGVAQSQTWLKWLSSSRVCGCVVGWCPSKFLQRKSPKERFIFEHTPRWESTNPDFWSSSKPVKLDFSVLFLSLCLPLPRSNRNWVLASGKNKRGTRWRSQPHRLNVRFSTKHASAEPEDNFTVKFQSFIIAYTEQFNYLNENVLWIRVTGELLRVLRKTIVKKSSLNINSYLFSIWNMYTYKSSVYIYIYTHRYIHIYKFSINSVGSVYTCI